MRGHGKASASHRFNTNVRTALRRSQLEILGNPLSSRSSPIPRSLMPAAGRAFSAWTGATVPRRASPTLKVTVDREGKMKRLLNALLLFKASAPMAAQ